MVWQTRIRLPNEIVKLIGTPKVVAQGKYTATFQTPLSMNKIDIKNYLTNIYGMKVDTVNTLIRLGPWQRQPVPRMWQKNKMYRRHDSKKAYVTFSDSDALAISLQELDNEAIRLKQTQHQRRQA